MDRKITTVELPKAVHAKVKFYCNRYGFKIKAFVARVLLDAVTDKPKDEEK